MTSKPRLSVASALVLVAGVAGGCTVDVLLGFPAECDYNGARHEDTTTFVAADGCNTCTCDDGTVTCSNDPACKPRCEVGALTYAEGQSFAASDGCNTCTCQPDGTVDCTNISCGCRAEPPLCEQPPMADCYVEPLCNGSTWECDVKCPCDESPIPDCPIPPDGCAWTGPYCDGQQWTCGELTCDCVTTMPGPCKDPGIPGCWSEPWCDGFGWTCIVTCDQCLDPPPICESMSGMGCTAYPYCDPMYGWMCWEECPQPGCMEEPPVCDPLDANCYGQPICLDGAWYCETACN